MIGRGRFKAIVKTQLDLFEQEHSDLLAACDAAEAAYNAAPREEAEERYGDYLAVQTLDQGMDRARDSIVAGLVSLLSPKGIVLRNDASVRRKEELPLETVVAHGEIPPVVPVRMNGLQFHADLLQGQKTGIFLDQRENYVAAARYARGKALDCFTSTGGFALHLASKCLIALSLIDLPFTPPNRCSGRMIRFRRRSSMRA